MVSPSLHPSSVTTAILDKLNLPHRTAEQVEHRIQTHNREKNISHFCVNDMKLVGKTEAELQKQMQTEPSVMISVWNLDLTGVQSLYLRKEK